MFSICGVNHYENTHSAIIAELLSPNGTHGLKSKLLECFVETLGESFTIPDFNYGKSRVYTEILPKKDALIFSLKITGTRQSSLKIIAVR